MAIAVLAGRAVPAAEHYAAHAPPPTPRERMALADNDAQRDIERDIHEQPPADPRPRQQEE